MTTTISGSSPQKNPETNISTDSSQKSCPHSEFIFHYIKGKGGMAFPLLPQEPQGFWNQRRSSSASTLNLKERITGYLGAAQKRSAHSVGYLVQAKAPLSALLSILGLIWLEPLHLLGNLLSSQSSIS